MERVLKSAADTELGTDDWRVWADVGAEAEAELPSDASGWLWPQAVWQEQGEQLVARGAAGLWLETEADLDALDASVLSRLDLIGIDFKVFSDGRGLSLARLLRSRYNYTGELRAFGDILPDLIDYMYRCGFNSFILRAASDFTAARDILKLQEHYYQTSEIEPKPLFLRKHRSTP